MPMPPEWDAIDGWRDFFDVHRALEKKHTIENGRFIVPRFEILQAYEVIPGAFRKLPEFKTYIYRTAL